MGFENIAVIFVSVLSGGLFVVGVLLLSAVTYRVAHWLTEAEYDQWMEHDISKYDKKQKQERRAFEEKITTIERLKQKIKEKETEKGIRTQSQKDIKAKEDAEEEEEKQTVPEVPTTEEEKRLADIEAILNLPTY